MSPGWATMSKLEGMQNDKATGAEVVGRWQMGPSAVRPPGGHPNSSGCGHFKLPHLAVRSEQADVADRTT